MQQPPCRPWLVRWRSDPALLEILVQHFDTVATVPAGRSVGDDETLLFDLAQSEEADAQVGGSLLGREKPTGLFHSHPSTGAQVVDPLLPVLPEEIA